MMCGALSKANKETVFPTRDGSSSKTDETRLPGTFFVISICWIFLSGSWMLWNDEARLFVYRKIFNLIYFCIQRVCAEKPKVKRNITGTKQLARKKKQQSCDCETNNACPNCIAQEVVKKKAGSRKQKC